MSAKLLLKHEGLTLSSYEVNKKVMSIGRSAENDIQLDDAAVSGQHARLVLKPNDYLENHNDVYLEDLGSTNGTIVNDARIIKQVLKHGDVIRIGSHEFTFDSGEKDLYDSTAIYLPDS